MIIASTGLAVDQGLVISEETLGALIMFVALLTAAFAPNFSLRVQVIIHCNLILLVLVSLLNDGLYHCDTFGQVVVRIGSNEHV
jgi:hypothetical protein